MEEKEVVTQVTKPGVMVAIKTGLRFVMSPGKDAPAMMGTFALVTLVWMFLSQGIGGQAGTFFGIGGGLGALLTLSTQFLLSLPVTVWAIQKALTGQATGSYFNLFGQGVTWRLLASGLLVGVLLAVPLLLAIVGLLVSGGLGAGALQNMLTPEVLGNLGGLQGEMTPIVMGVVGVLLLIVTVVGLRFAFLSAFVVDKDRVDLFGAFSATKGVVWRIIGTLLVTSIVVGLVGSVVSLAIGFVMVSVPALMVVSLTLQVVLMRYLSLMALVAVVSLYSQKKSLEG